MLEVVWWNVLSELAKTKNNPSAFNAKSKDGEAKSSTSFY